MDFTFVSQYGFQLGIFAVVFVCLVAGAVFYFEKWLNNEKVNRAIIHPEKWEQYLNQVN